MLFGDDIACFLQVRILRTCLPRTTMRLLLALILLAQVVCEPIRPDIAATDLRDKLGWAPPIVFGGQCRRAPGQMMTGMGHVQIASTVNVGWSRRSARPMAGAVPRFRPGLGLVLRTFDHGRGGWSRSPRPSASIEYRRRYLTLAPGKLLRAPSLVFDGHAA